MPDHAPMHATPTPISAARELCHRSNDGIDVTLWWLPGDEHLRVTVIDTKLNECFSLRADAGRAMRVFNHPYLYPQVEGIPLPAAAVADGRSPAWTGELS